MTNDINETLNERGKRYGDFYGHACFSQKLKRVMQKMEYLPLWT